MQRLLSGVGVLGVGLATVGAAINSTLYNGTLRLCISYLVIIFPFS